jgi:hypothetical protein
LSQRISLLKNIARWVLTLTVCLLSVSCTLSNAEPTASVYLFRKNATFSNLTFVGTKLQEVGSFNVNNSYYVGDAPPFVLLPEEMKHAWAFCMMCISFLVFIITSAAVIINSCHVVSIKVGFEKSMRIFRISFMVWFLVFCGAVFSGVFPSVILNKCTVENTVVTYFSIISNWNMTLVTIIFLVDLVIIAFKSRTNNEFADETKHITNSGFAAEDGFYESLKKVFRISLIIGMVLIVICASFVGCLLWSDIFGSDIFGPDDISQYTGHFYVNTLMESVDTISTNIRNM